VKDVVPALQTNREGVSTLIITLRADLLLFEDPEGYIWLSGAIQNQRGIFRQFQTRL
jgi:hypothetical protein